MRLNSKVALLLLGLLVGGIAGYLTRPEAAEIRMGGTSIEFSNNKVSAGPSGSLTTGQSEHILIFAASGGIFGLLVGFAAGKF